MYKLSDTILYNTLNERRTPRAEHYISFLQPLERDMDVLLGYIRQLFPDYPDHGLQHSIRIIEYVGNIISAEQLEDMSSLEIFIFILSALFHDTGMVLYNSDKKEEIRENHHCFAQQVIDEYFDTNFNNLEEKDRIKDVVIFVCYAHCIPLEELKTCREFSVDCKISFERVRYGLLAFLLRIGDLMDLEGERANNFRMQMFSENFTETALEHNRRHQNVKLYQYNPDKIIIEVAAENIQQYKIWHDWFSYLEQDILCANTYLQATQYHFPRPETTIVKADGAKYDVQELRFEIDKKGSMLEIVSKSIYTNELDFVRELVQNAIDATLKKVYLDEEQELKHISPRSWKKSLDINPVFVAYSEKQKKFFVMDQGIGMNQEDLENFLFKVSSSGMVQSSKRKFDFPGIAQYGIGFVSCLINADKIHIFTSKEAENNIHRVTMSSGLNMAFTENEVNDCRFTGTVIELTLKKDFTSKEIQSYLERTFCYPSIDIQYVNLDMAENVMEKVSGKNKVKSAMEKPYTLINYLNEVHTIADNKAKPFRSVQKQIEQFEKKYNELNLFFQKEYISIFSKKKTQDFNRRVELLQKDIPNAILEKEFPDFKKSLEEGLKERGEEELFHFMMNMFSEYALIITTEKGKCKMQLQDYDLNMRKINLNHLAIGEDWRYLVAFFDDDFSVYDIQYSNSPIDLSGKTGLILFKHYGEDYEKGIEYVALNGFLFKNGQVYNRLARLTACDEDYNDNYAESFVIGLEYDDYDIREQVEEYIESHAYENEENDIIMYYNNGRYEPQNRFRTEYDVIHIENNQFCRINNVEVFKVKNPFYNAFDENEESMDLYEDIVRKKGQKLIEGSLIELQNCIDAERNSYYQDGIAIASKLNSLFPVGFFRIVCNCTADARMKLNVTRHEASEIRTDVDEWVHTTGKKIQTMVYDSLKDMMEQEQLYIEFDNLVADKEDRAYFEQECLKSLRTILE